MWVAATVQGLGTTMTQADRRIVPVHCCWANSHGANLSSAEEALGPCKECLPPTAHAPTCCSLLGWQEATFPQQPSPCHLRGKSPAMLGNLGGAHENSHRWPDNLSSLTTRFVRQLLRIVASHSLAPPRAVIPSITHPASRHPPRDRFLERRRSPSRSRRSVQSNPSFSRKS